MKKLSKLLRLILISLMFLGVFSYTYKADTLAETTSDFEKNEQYYQSLCSKDKLTEKELAVCQQYRDYLSNKQDEINNRLNGVMNNIDAIKKDILNQGEKLAELDSDITYLERQISYIENDIKGIEDVIDQLTKDIEEKEILIEKLDGQIKASMVAAQASFSTNSYVKFIMGATDFVDLIRRVSAVNNITSFTKRQVEEAEIQRAALAQDKEMMQQQKDKLVEKQAQLKAQVSSLEKVRTLTQQLINEFHLKEAALVAELEKLEKSTTTLEDMIGDLNGSLDPLSNNASWGTFVRNKTFWVSSGCYYYQETSGGFHPALDFAMTMNTNLYAVASGKVMDTFNGCRSYSGSHLNDTCGSGKGNWLRLIVKVDNKYYFVQYQHLTESLVSRGDDVSKGQLIALSGNSGMSTGPHLHLMVIYLGTTKTTNVEKLYKLYNSYPAGSRHYFGLPANISSACYIKGTAPCIMDPTDIFGYVYNKWYTVN